MKELMKVYGNGHCVALITLAVGAFVLAIAESDSVCMLLLSKLISLVLMGVCGLLCRRWSKQGKIDELLDVEE